MGVHAHSPEPVSRPAPTLASPPPATQPVRSVVSPLLPVLLPLVVAAVVLGAVFAWLFPPDRHAGAPAVRFTDITAASGLRFTHRQGGAEAPTTLGGAVTVLDFNHDGRPDLFFVNGAPWPWEESLEKRLGRSSALYRNDGNGRFTDVTDAAGLAKPDPKYGALWAIAGAFFVATWPTAWIAVGLALVTSLAGTAQTTIGLVLLRGRLAGLDGRHVARRFGQYALAAIPASVAGVLVGSPLGAFTLDGAARSSDPGGQEEHPRLHLLLQPHRG